MNSFYTEKNKLFYTRTLCKHTLKSEFLAQTNPPYSLDNSTFSSNIRLILVYLPFLKGKRNMYRK